MTRQEIKAHAKATFTSNYGPNMVAYLIYSIVLAAASYVTGGIAAVIVSPALLSGIIIYYLDVYTRAIEPSINTIFAKGFAQLDRKMGMYWWVHLFTFLWSLLFVIPGYIKRLSYSMAMYIVSDSKTVKVRDAMKLSMRMTDGHLFEIFVFQMSFLGWFMLSSLTAGLLSIFYVGPYYQNAMGGLYLELKRRAIESGKITYDELYPPEETVSYDPSNYSRQDG